MPVHPVAIVARREIRDTFSDWRIVVPLLALAVGFPLLVLYGIKLGAPMLDRPDLADIVSRLITFGALVVGFFPSSFSLVIALESFAGERERGTLEALFACPLSDGELYVGKLLAVLLPPILLSLLALSIYSFGIQIILGEGLAFDFFIQVLLLSAVEALVMVAGAVVVSSHTTSVRAANLLASFVILPIAFIVQAESLLVLMEYHSVLWLVVAGLCVLAVILVRVGLHTFSREELLGRVEERAHVGKLVRKLGRLIVQPAAMRSRSRQSWHLPFPVRLYVEDIPILLRSHWLPLFMALMAVVAGLVGGYAYSFSEPVGSILDDLRPLIQTMELPDEQVEISAAGILLHNLRALLIYVVLSPPTFGAASLFMVLLPSGLVGLLAGLLSQVGLDPWVFLAAFVLPHGVVEFTAAIIATAFILRIGASSISPRQGNSIGDSILVAFADFVKMLAVIVPLFVIASLIEAEITPRVASYFLGG